MDAHHLVAPHDGCCSQIKPTSITWIYRNGIKALPWFTHVREKLEDPASWGWFMAKAGCNPVRSLAMPLNVINPQTVITQAPGVYTCGPNATANLYHDFEQVGYHLVAWGALFMLMLVDTNG